MPNRDQLQQTIATLQAERLAFDSQVLATVLAVLRERLMAMPKQEAETNRVVYVPDEQRKQATILFATVEGLTRLAGASRQTGRLREIGDLWQRLDTVIRAHGGTVDKHMGDVVMGIFGAPTAHEDDPDRAIRCALAIQTTVREFLGAIGHQREDDPFAGAPLDVRIGINTGFVSLGRVGSDRGVTAIGDAVNVASRLKEAVREGGIYVAQDTYRLVRDVYRVEPLGQFAIKGRREMVDVYRVIDSQSQSSRSDSDELRAAKVSLMGRESEIEMLLAMSQEMLRSGQRQMLTIIGDVGVGKTRLVQALQQTPDVRGAGLLWFYGRATPRQVRTAFGLARDLVLRLLDIRDGMLPSAIEDLLAQRLAPAPVAMHSAVGAGTSPQEAARAITRLFGLASEVVESVNLAPGPSTAQPEHTMAALLDYFAGVAQDARASIFILDDVHWADDASLELMRALVNQPNDRPLWLICLARPQLLERFPEWPGDVSVKHQMFRLGPLSDTDCRKLAYELFSRLTDVSPELVDAIVRSAGGNPYYVQEFTKVLLDDGVIVPGDAQRPHRTQELHQLRMPPTLRAVLQTRLDQLPEVERLVAQQASVVGSAFWDSAVQAINRAARQPFTGAQVSTALNNLEQRGIIFRAALSEFPESRAYHFHHAVMRDVAYESVLLRDRPVYHWQVARWLESQSSDHLAEYAAVIAPHYEVAGQHADAARLFELAADISAVQYRFEDAIAEYRHALKLLRNQPQHQDRRPGIMARMGQLLCEQGRLVEALASYQEMWRWAEQGGDLQAQAAAANGMSWIHNAMTDHETALRTAEQAEQVSRLAGADVELLYALIHRGRAALHLHLLPQAEEAAQEALRRSRAQDLAPEVARALALLAQIARQTGNEKALTAARDELATAAARQERMGDKQALGQILSLMGDLALRESDVSQAWHHLQEALELLREAGNQAILADTLRLLGLALCRGGQSSAALSPLSEAVELAEITGNRYLALWCRLALGEALLIGERYEAAEVTLRKVITAAQDPQRLGRWVGLAEANRLLSRVLAKQP